jgi:hypothetical protein
MLYNCGGGLIHPLLKKSHKPSYSTNQCPRVSCLLLANILFLILQQLGKLKICAESVTLPFEIDVSNDICDD